MLFMFICDKQGIHDHNDLVLSILFIYILCCNSSSLILKNDKSKLFYKSIIIFKYIKYYNLKLKMVKKFKENIRSE